MNCMVTHQNISESYENQNFRMLNNTFFFFPFLDHSGVDLTVLKLPSVKSYLVVSGQGVDRRQPRTRKIHHYVQMFYQKNYP